MATSDENGDVIDTYTYDSFGNSDTLTGNPYRYTGRRLDAETGLYYYRAWYYSPALGRFLQTDPVGYEDQMNLYTYVGNDPTNYTDPQGENKHRKDNTIEAGGRGGSGAGVCGGYCANRNARVVAKAKIRNTLTDEKLRRQETEKEQKKRMTTLVKGVRLVVEIGRGVKERECLTAKLVVLEKQRDTIEITLQENVLRMPPQIDRVEVSLQRSTIIQLVENLTITQQIQMATKREHTRIILTKGKTLPRIRDEMSTELVWIGLFHVVQGRSRPLGKSVAGSYVQIVGKARDRASFWTIVEKCLFEEGFAPIEMMDVEVLDQSYMIELGDDLQELVKLARTQYPVQWKEWHSYPIEDLPVSEFNIGQRVQILGVCPKVDCEQAFGNICGFWEVETEDRAKELGVDSNQLVYVIDDGLEGFLLLVGEEIAAPN